MKNLSSFLILVLLLCSCSNTILYNNKFLKYKYQNATITLTSTKCIDSNVYVYIIDSLYDSGQVRSLEIYPEIIDKKTCIGLYGIQLSYKNMPYGFGRYSLYLNDGSTNYYFTNNDSLNNEQLKLFLSKYRYLFRKSEIQTIKDIWNEGAYLIGTL